MIRKMEEVGRSMKQDRENIKNNIKTYGKKSNQIKRFTVSKTLVGKFNKDQISDFIEWLKSIKFNNLVIKSENNTLRISSDNCDEIESILKASPFESYGFKITEIMEEV